ncbi:MAG: TIGR00282 family metallophosphoesterase [bacterium]|nr:TIGR00282 family metallophosphoesterase [bacterium]MDZ4247849.1 TIGR00282 family metallophosphoesterase [Patescibacteria group bacterium]
MKILFFGDIVGKPGQAAVKEAMSVWKDQYQPDFVIANAENANPGDIVTPKILDELISTGIEAFTYGDHFFDGDFSKVAEYPIVRPHNFSGDHPGTGYKVFETALHRQVAVINLMGQAFVKPRVENYFNVIDELLKKIDPSDAIFVDFHAETTSETEAIGWHLDGRVSAVIGTHTHVPTADTRLLPKGTAFQADVGMSGAVNAIIGMDIERANAWIRRQLGEDVPKSPPKDPRTPYAVDAVLIETDGPTKSKSIKRLTTRPAA